MENKIIRSCKIVFIISQLWWLLMLIMVIYNSFKGVDSGWLIPSLSSHELIYGVEVIDDSIFMAIFMTFFTPMIIIPIYQVGYIIFILAMKIKNRKN